MARPPGCLPHIYTAMSARDPPGLTDQHDAEMLKRVVWAFKFFLSAALVDRAMWHCVPSQACRCALASSLLEGPPHARFSKK